MRSRLSNSRRGPINHATLAASLADAPATDRVALLHDHPGLADVDLALALKRLYFEHNVSDPGVAAGAAAALDALAAVNGGTRIEAIAAWVDGMARQLDGHMDAALERLEYAETLLARLGDGQTAASVSISKVGALAMLGRYDEGIACGLRARNVLVKAGDLLAAGKIEQNLGGIHFRRDRYADAEHMLRSARERFIQIGNQKQLAQIENNLAIALTMQHRFREAAELLEQALARAAAEGLRVTQAEIEDDLGQLALSTGRYDQALDYLERARRGFAELGLTHASAGADKQLADAYLELNLAPEASTAYDRVLAVFRDLRLRAEEAGALANAGRARALVGDAAEAQRLLHAARQLYLAEDNEVGQATVTLFEAQLHHARERYSEAADAAALAEAPLARAGTWRRLLLARWIRGDSLRALGQTRAARRLLDEALQDAQHQALPQIAYRCETSLGLLAASSDDAASAEASFGRAIQLIEDLRAPLPAEEFRTAFVADKLLPYMEMVRLCLQDAEPGRLRQALQHVEGARSRALVDVLGGAFPDRLHARDAFEADLLRRLGELREDLSWLYSRLNQAPDPDRPTPPDTVAQLHASVRDREARVLELMRQLQHQGHGNLVRVEPLDLQALQAELGTHTAVVEYFTLHDEILAFIVTGDTVEVRRQLTTETTVLAILKQLRFQLTAFHGGADLASHIGQLTQRTQHHLRILHEALLRSVESAIGDRRLVVVPHRALHYVPFHALYDGATYAIERREVIYAASAAVLRHSLAAPRRDLRRALFVGVPDARIPRVGEEIATLAGLFGDAVTLIGEDATRSAVHAHAADADLIHLASHARFRPDNPLFSALQLGDGWLTARDAYEWDLDGRLVTLSACETGVSAIAPGDELMGLVRGFLSAGAPSLIVSMWTVEDASTADLMADVYTRLRRGDSPGRALRDAQCGALRSGQHPFFWAPFALFGRW